MIENRIIIGIGSNIEPFLHIRRAMELLKSNFSVLAVSSLRTTKPIGIEDQCDFINLAVLVCSNLTMDRVTPILKQIENELGRDRSMPKFGPRTIDLDIVMWNNEIIDEDYYSRDFLRELVDEIKDYKV